MEKLNLVVKFSLSSDRRLHVKAATRIKVDGRGGLMLYDAEDGSLETIDLQELQAFSIQPIACPKHCAAALV